MRLVSGKFYLGALGVFTALLVGTASARAQTVYQVDDGTAFERFNNSDTTETEDNWCANSFTVVAGGTNLVSISLGLGETYNNRAVTLAIYSNDSLTDPTNLVRIATTDTTLTGVAGPPPNLVELALDAPVALNEGDIFWAAVLLRAVPGTEFPYYNNNMPSILGRSFFDVGPAQGAPYDLDVTGNATVNGARHPVVFEAQSAGNTIIRVNAN